MHASVELNWGKDKCVFGSVFCVVVYHFHSKGLIQHVQICSFATSQKVDPTKSKESVIPIRTVKLLSSQTVVISCAKYIFNAFVSVSFRLRFCTKTKFEVDVDSLLMDPVTFEDHPFPPYMEPLLSLITSFPRPQERMSLLGPPMTLSSPSFPLMDDPVAPPHR